MAKIKKIAVKGQNYDLAAKYDDSGNIITDTYIVKSELTTETNNRITSETAIKADVSSLQTDKQDKLVAGEGVEIEGNVIKAPGSPSTTDEVIEMLKEVFN